MHSNRFGSLFSHKQQPLYTPSACACVHVCVCMFVTIRDLHAVRPALFVPGLSQTGNLRHRETVRQRQVQQSASLQKTP